MPLRQRHPCTSTDGTAAHRRVHVPRQLAAAAALVLVAVCIHLVVSPQRSDQAQEVAALRQRVQFLTAELDSVRGSLVPVPGVAASGISVTSVRLAAFDASHDVWRDQSGSGSGGSVRVWSSSANCTVVVDQLVRRHGRCLRPVAPV